MNKELREETKKRLEFFKEVNPEVYKKEIKEIKREKKLFMCLYILMALAVGLLFIL